jgi:hypothetical protein
VPLTRAGDLTPSLLCAMGLPNPAAGAILWFLIAPVLGWMLWSLRPQRTAGAWAATVLTAGILCGFQVLTYRDSPSDRAALALLRRVWLAPPGQTFAFRSLGRGPLRTLAR